MSPSQKANPRMHVVLGRTLDGGSFPTVLHGCNASAGRLHLGLTGFLARLEQSLGIPTPLTHEPVRVAEYAKRIAVQDDGKQFYSASRAGRSLACCTKASYSQRRADFCGLEWETSRQWFSQVKSVCRLGGNLAENTRLHRAFPIVFSRSSRG